MNTNKPHGISLFFAHAGVFLLACFLLFRQLDRPNLWVDEFATLQMISGSFAGVVDACIRDIHPPLYFILLKGWALLCGESDVAIRALSVLFASASVIGMGLLAKQLLGPNRALLPMLFMGVHPAFIQFARMARYYSLVLMLGLLSTVFLLSAISTARKRYWGLYALSSVLLLYTFYPGGILLLAQGLAFILPAWKRRSSRIWICCMAIAAALFAPWAVYVVSGQFSFFRTHIGSDLAHSAIGFILGAGISFYTFSVGETIFPWRVPALLGLISVICLIVAALWGARKTVGIKTGGITGVSILFMSFVTTFLSVQTPFINTPVRVLFALPFFILTVSVGVYAVQKPILKKAVIFLLVVVWVNGLLNYYTEREFLNPIYFTPARHAARIVAQHVEKDDLVISDLDSIFVHYFTPLAPENRHLLTTQTEEISQFLTRRTPPRVWVVTIGRDRTRHASPVPVIRKALAGTYRLSDTRELLPIDPTYRHIKNKILRRDTYRHRLTIETYERDH